MRHPGVTRDLLHRFSPPAGLARSAPRDVRLTGGGRVLMGLAWLLAAAAIVAGGTAVPRGVKDVRRECGDRPARGHDDRCDRPRVAEDRRREAGVRVVSFRRGRHAYRRRNADAPGRLARVARRLDRARAVSPGRSKPVEARRRSCQATAIRHPVCGVRRAGVDRAAVRVRDQPSTLAARGGAAGAGSRHGDHEAPHKPRPLSSPDHVRIPAAGRRSRKWQVRGVEGVGRRRDDCRSVQIRTSRAGTIRTRSPSSRPTWTRGSEQTTPPASTQAPAPAPAAAANPIGRCVLRQKGLAGAR